MIHFVDHVIQHPVIAHHILMVFCRDRDLIGNAPADDARMVIVLNDELLHLAYRVVPAVRHMLADIRDLRPDDHAVPVTKIIKELVVLIMCEADRVGSDFANELHVLFMLFLCDRISASLPVLMAGDAVERIRSSVQKKAGLRIEAKFPDTEGCSDPVYDLSILYEKRLRAVKVGIPESVPSMHVRQMNADALPEDPLPVCFALCVLLRNDPVLRVKNADLHISFARDPRVDEDFRILSIRLRGNTDPGSAVIEEVKMIFIYDKDLYIPINPSVKCKISFLRIYPVVHGIVHKNLQLVLLQEKIRDIRPECGIPAVVDQDLCTVQRHLAAGVHTVEYQEDPLFLRRIVGSGKRLLINARSAEIIISAVLTVDRVPGVRQIADLGLGSRHRESPVFHKKCLASHAILLVRCVLLSPHFRNFENKNNAFYFCGHFCDISGRGFHPLETCAARSTKKGGFSSPPFFVRSSQPIP